MSLCVSYDGTGNFSVSFWLATVMDTDVTALHNASNEKVGVGSNGVEKDSSQFRGLFYKG